MQEAEEQDTCRICSAPAEEDQPLFHPCKCSGTIRYIHQDCLTTWLAHSKKKSCDVCKHPYSFTKVYAPDMPSRLPPVLLIRRLAQQALFALLFVARATTVAVIWLAVLPWLTVWIWRTFFSMGESAAWWIADRPRPTVEDSASFYYSLSADTTLPPPRTWVGKLTSHPLWIALSADIFTGQIIASLIVLTFIAVFLLREWISQNARPGVFEDEDILPDEQPEVPAAPVPPPPQNPPLRRRQLDDMPLDNVLAQRQMEAMRVIDALRAREGANGGLIQDQDLPERTSFDRPHKRGRRIGGPSPSPETSWRAHRREEMENPRQRRTFSRKNHSSRTSAAPRVQSVPRDAEGVPPRSTLDEGLTRATFDFTFPTGALRDRDTNSEPSASSTSVQQQGATIPPSDSQADATQSRESNSLFTFRIPQESTSSNQQYEDPYLTPYLSDSSPYQPRIRRPPLPISAMPYSEPREVSFDDTPLEFSNMAIYYPPEDLELNAGPSKNGLSGLNGYSSNGGEIDYEDGLSRSAKGKGKRAMPLDPEEEMDIYFRDLDAADVRTKLETSDEESDGKSDGNLLVDNVEIGGADGNAHGVKAEPDNAEDDEDEEEEDEEEGINLVFEDGQWHAVEDGEEEEEEDVEDVQPAEGDQDVNQGDGGVQGNQAPVDEGLPPDLNDDMDGNVEDDMEGAMEAIGMRGPVYGVLQNAALMIMVLATAIGLGVGIPFTLGKSAALLSLDPPRFLQILHLPIRGIRVLTDPVVDLVAFLIADLLLPPFVRLGWMLISFIYIGFLYFVKYSFGHQTADKISHVSSELGKKVANITVPLSKDTFSWSQAPHEEETDSLLSSLYSTLETACPHVMEKLEPYFATLGKSVRFTHARARSAWVRLALGHDTSQKVFAVILGYAVIGLILAFYLNVLAVGKGKSTNRTVRNAVRQQLLVFKVASFIFIELVTFPLGCGIVLDLCTVWLFPEANLMSRASFFYQAPLTAMFYHWVAGTMFMYSFAVLLSGCRGVMRPGAMWFIKDPQDQNSHPIRDILDRPTLTQLRKIAVSGVMYACVVACVVGSVAGLLLLGSKSIMPFRWKNREPLSNVPVDLLFLNLVLPYTMRYFRPRKAIKEFATVVWKYLAVRLRLTSYFFGGRHATEEYTPKYWRSLSLALKNELPDADAVLDGAFRRVPATDNIALPRDMRATAQVTELGEPFDDYARQLMELQNAEAIKAKRNIRDDYMVVYIPPRFRYRVISFIVLLWIIGAILLGISVALPIQLGRSFFNLFTKREVHDGYALIVGFYLLWGCYLVGKAVDRLDKRRQRRGGDGPRGDLRLLVIKRGLLWIVKTTYMVTCLGIMIPALISFVVDLYLILPIRFALDPDFTPKIRAVDSWALGILYAKIALHAQRIQPQNRITRGIQRITANGWTHPHPVHATKEVIGPVGCGLLGMIILPAVVLKLVQHLLPKLPVDDKFIFMHVYPGIFMLAGLVRLAIVLFGLLSTWSQIIRDKEFLVEMRLRNHETENETENDVREGHANAS